MNKAKTLKSTESLMMQTPLRALRKCKVLSLFIICSGKDEFLTKINVAQVGAEVANLLRGKTWDERFKWVTDIKD